MKKIESLTNAQAAHLIEFRQQWLDVGLCCKPADYNKAEENITTLYKKLEKEKPIFFHFSSPIMCELGLATLKILFAKNQLSGQLWGQLSDQLRDQLSGQLRGQLWDQLRGQLSGQLWDQLWGQLGDQLSDQLRDQLSGQLRDQLSDQLKGQLWDQLSGQLWGQLKGQLWDQLSGQLWGQLSGQLWDQLWDQLSDQLWDQLSDQLCDQLSGQLRGQLCDQLRDQLWGQLSDQLWDQLRDQLWGQLKKTEFYNNCFIGQHESAWIAFYKFGLEIGAKYKDKDIELLNVWGAISESVAWWSPFEGVCIICDRPRSVSFDDRRRLHSETGASVKFSDGWGVHAWHGTRIPKKWIEDRKSLTAKTALTWDNIEQRRAACEILGWATILKGLNAKTIDKDGDPQIGELVEVEIPGIGKEKFLRVVCGTGREFALPVPPEMKTAIQANSWSYGLTPELFKPEIRT